MIVEKIYSDDNADKILESDIDAIKSIVEKYEIYEIFDTINEKNDWKNRHMGSIYGSHYNGTAGSTVRGLSGVLQSIPSFTISMLLSPTLTGVAAVGALCHRFKQRWDDKESWRNRLIPSFWADNLANPGNYSIPHRVVSGTGKVIKGTGIALAGGILGPLAWPKLKAEYNKLKDKAPNWMKKLVAIGTAAGVGSKLASKNGNGGADSSMNIDLDKELQLTPEDVKNIDFREYWLTFSNGEVFRVKADSPEHAKALGALIISHAAQPKGRYERFNSVIRIDPRVKRYEFYFDDGEMCYSAGIDDKDAKKVAMDYRKALCDTINNSDKGLIPVEPLTAASIYAQGTPKKGKLIPVPDINNIKVSTTPPPRKGTNKPTRLKIPVYAYDGMNDYKVSFMDCYIHFPAMNEREVLEMIKVFYKNYGARVMQKIDSNARRNQDQFKVKMGDGDFYYIYASSSSDATTYANEMQEAKLKSALHVLNDKNPLENFLGEFGELAKKIVSIDPVPINKRKIYNISTMVGVKKIASSADDTNDIFNKFDITKIL